jgi:serine/threonine protein kinase
MSIVEVRIGQRYKLNNLIGKGLFSEVFEGENVYTGERVAIKLEDLKIRYAQLNFEAQILKQLQGGRKPHSASRHPAALLVRTRRRLQLSGHGAAGRDFGALQAALRRQV